MGTFDISENKRYLKFSYGKLVEEFKNHPGGDQKVLEREKTAGDNKGDIVYFYQYRAVTGWIDDIKVRYSNFSKAMEISISITGEAGEKIVIQERLLGPYGKRFMFLFRNINLKEKVRISGYRMEKDKGKGYNEGITIYQKDSNGEMKYKIAPYYQYEDFPKPYEEYDEEKRKDVWMYKEHNAALLKEFYKDLLYDYPEAMPEDKREDDRRDDDRGRDESKGFGDRGDDRRGDDRRGDDRRGDDRRGDDRRGDDRRGDDRRGDDRRGDDNRQGKGGDQNFGYSDAQDMPGIDSDEDVPF